MPMDARKFRILQAIIDDYILTAIPVGSRTISKKYETGLSSATIRNEMSDLEELGYLDQPHVSAGRVPSAKAYRLYVDQLLESGQISSPDLASIRTHFANRTRQMEDVIGRAAQVISSMTHYTSLVMTPQNPEMRIRNLQLVPVSTNSALVVIVTDVGVLRDAVIHTGESLDADALYNLSRLLTEKLSGCTLSQAKQLLAEYAEGVARREEVLSGIAGLLTDADSMASQGSLALGGTSNILNYPEYSDVEKAKSFLSLLEAKDTLRKLLAQHQQMAFTVRIGPETGIPELKDCSLVTATYYMGHHKHGTIGVIGPTRMQYGNVLSVLSAMGQQLSDLLTQDKE